ncbi:short-chain dehydrogenase [Sphingobium sp. 22B]|uniref:SDR family oxidoreductase n=1 Tax=unclassified Sphingobium TaxID=2611147 RepID=UPI000784DD7E|nr:MULTISPECIES: SDR family oxidoreductase [unclassified Sphingobium]KXU33327.1 short-chain dehydrogenase [Sphingobium sp. AM]KYC31497.1 short-chain dehydrogenase [Sphingobium sp. 22B]OAP30741.1 short-chain dehydrogenase [Sphingobium sp. 20006FA]
MNKSRGGTRMPCTHIVITGASSGIGQATAQAFAARGGKLVLAARDGEALEAVAETCRRAGAEVLVVPLDVADADAVRQLARSARDFCGSIDLWFSNVGVGAVGKFVDVPIEVHERTIRSNLIGHMNDAHAVLPIFMAQRHGIFVNMISLGGLTGTPYAAAYGASKFGLRGFSEALRAEMTEWPDIHICDVYPAFVDTPALRHAGNYTGKALTAPPPILDPRRVAAAVVRLADRPRDSLLLGTPTWAVRFAHPFAPSLLSRIGNLAFGRYFASAERAPVTRGNLFDPPRDSGGIDGGFRKPATKRRKAALATGAGVAAGVLLLGLLTPRRQPGR